MEHDHQMWEFLIRFALIAPLYTFEPSFRQARGSVVHRDRGLLLTLQIGN